jgi:hypothetical protein
MTVIPAWGRQTHEDYEFKASLGYKTRSYLQKIKQEKNRKNLLLGSKMSLTLTTL